MTETPTAFRQVNPVLELSFRSMFPFSYLRRMPGIDIANEITSYHLADMVRLAKKMLSKAMHGLQKKPPSREMENDFHVC